MIKKEKKKRKKKGRQSDYFLIVCPFVYGISAI
jgi:hypothetical protein